MMHKYNFENATEKRDLLRMSVVVTAFDFLNLSHGA